MQQPPQGRTFRQWYRAQTNAARILLALLPAIGILIVGTCSLAAYASTLLPNPPQQAQSPTATSATTAATSAPTQSVAFVATATLAPTVTPTSTPSPSPTPNPSPTPKPTIPPPTPTPKPQPTATPCASPCNPWGYNFSPGSYIYSPNANFCSYFACISNFWNGRGYVNECQDGEYSLSGGIRGDCSYHGGELRPLYMH